MARVHAHPRSMGPKMDSLSLRILGSFLRNRFVSLLWIRQTSATRAFPTSSPFFSLLLFFRFHIATSCGKIVAKPTVDSINTNAEWFLTGFTRITGTEINEKDRAEVYRVSAPSYKRGGSNLIVSSGSG